MVALFTKKVSLSIGFLSGEIKRGKEVDEMRLERKMRMSLFLSHSGK